MSGDSVLLLSSSAQRAGPEGDDAATSSTDGLGRGCLPEWVHLAEAEARASENWAAGAESALSWYAWANEQLVSLVPTPVVPSSLREAAVKPESVRDSRFRSPRKRPTHARPRTQVTDAQAALHRLASFESSQLAERWMRAPGSLGPVALSRRGWHAVDRGPHRLVASCEQCGASLEFPSDAAWMGLLPWEGTTLVALAPLETMRKADDLLSTDALSSVKAQVVSAHYSGCPWKVSRL